MNANGESAASAEVWAKPGAPLTTFPQTFNFDDGTLDGWSPTGTWGLTSAVTYSGSAYAATNSPSGGSLSRGSTSITSPMFDLTGITSPSLSFYQEYYIDPADCAYVEVSTDGGSTFTALTPCYYGGPLSNFVQKSIDLTSYKSSSVVLRFRLEVTWSGTYDHWYVDDIVVQ